MATTETTAATEKTAATTETTTAPPSNGNDNQADGSDDIDITTPSWFYMDSNGLRQGPFSFKEMFLWWKSGYFSSTLLVKTAWDDHFRAVGDIPEFYTCPQTLVERIEKEQEQQLKSGQIEFPVYAAQTLNPTPPPAKTPGFQDYAVTGTFNPLTGKFQKEDSDSHFTAKGLSSDRALRMMDAYFDFEGYQAQRNASSGEKKVKKQPKGTKKFWKKRKEEKRRAKLVAEYLAD